MGESLRSEPPPAPVGSAASRMRHKEHGFYSGASGTEGHPDDARIGAQVVPLPTSDSQNLGAINLLF